MNLNRSDDVKKIICFSGLPGVGKSTISHEVCEELSATMVNIDNFKRADVDPTLVRTQIDPPEVRWKYYRDALEYTFKLFERGVHTAVLDEVFHLDALRSRLEALAKGHGVRVVWVEVRCSYEVVAKRLREKSREGHLLSTDEALRMHLLFKQIFEAFPKEAKNHIVVQNESSDDVTKAVGEVLKKC